MIGQAAARGRATLDLLDLDRLVLPETGNIAFQVFEPQGQLIRVEPFRTAAVLRPLNLLDDLLETFDLTITTGYNSSHITHQTVQKSRI